MENTTRGRLKANAGHKAANPVRKLASAICALFKVVEERLEFLPYG